MERPRQLPSHNRPELGVDKSGLLPECAVRNGPLAADRAPSYRRHAVAAGRYGRSYDGGAVLAEALAVQVLDERRQRRLPGFLTVVVELAELVGVHTQLARHLDLYVREMMTLARVDPGLQPIGYPHS